MTALITDFLIKTHAFLPINVLQNAIYKIKTFLSIKNYCYELMTFRVNEKLNRGFIIRPTVRYNKFYNV